MLSDSDKLSKAFGEKIAKSIGFRYFNYLQYVSEEREITDDILDISIINTVHDIETSLKNGISVFAELCFERFNDLTRLNRLFRLYDSMILLLGLNENQKNLFGESKPDTSIVNVGSFIDPAYNANSNSIFEALMKPIKNFIS